MDLYLADQPFDERSVGCEDDLATALPSNDINRHRRDNNPIDSSKRLSNCKGPCQTSKKRLYHDLDYYA